MAGCSFSKSYPSIAMNAIVTKPVCDPEQSSWQRTILVCVSAPEVSVRYLSGENDPNPVTGLSWGDIQLLKRS